MRRLRRRYLAIRITGGGPCSYVALRDRLEAEHTALFGLWGLSQAGIRVLEFDEATKEAIIACWHTWLPNVRSSATMVTDLEGGPTILQVKGVSGTLRRLRRKFLTQTRKT